MLIDQRARDKGTAERYRATEVDGTFCYALFKTFATKETRGRGVPPTDLRFFFCHAQANGVFITHLRFVDLIPVDMARPQEYQQVCARLY